MNVNQGEELYDVIMKVPSYGIHNPKNLHSFAFISPVFNVYICSCDHCKETLYPFTNAAKCLCCSCFLHRSCANKVTAKCTGFLVNTEKGNTMFSDWRCNAYQTPNTPVLKELTTPLCISECHRLISELGILLDGSPLPSPGSSSCVWRRALQSISKDFKLNRINKLPEQSRILEKVTFQLLTDPNSFPGQVSVQLKELYLALPFTENKDFLLHAREALDNISCSVLSVLPEGVDSNPDQLKAIVNFVDYMVLKSEDGNMYRKVYSAATRMGQSADRSLVKSLYDADKELGLNTDECTNTEESQVERSLWKVPSQVTALNKLKFIVRALKHVSLSVAKGDTQTITESCNEHKEGVSDHESSSSFQVSTMGADVLMERFTAIIARQTLKYVLNWHAEVVYIEAMCREQEWLLGAEGYALVTLEQSLRVLNPTKGGSAPVEPLHHSHSDVPPYGPIPVEALSEGVTE